MSGVRDAPGQEGCGPEKVAREAEMKLEQYQRMVKVAVELAEDRGLEEPMICHEAKIGPARLFCFEDKHGKRDWLIAI